MTLTPYQQSRQVRYRIRGHISHRSVRHIGSTPRLYWQQPRRWLGLRTHAALTQYSLEHLI